MSKGFWRTEKPIEPLQPGKTLEQRIETYLQTWESRCYPDGISDEVPYKLMRSGRAPSWKAIALAILRNDMNLTSLGFEQDEGNLARRLRQDKQRYDAGQFDIFGG